jgi:glycosyltransferase involved in cell wall biosynthesis
MHILEIPSFFPPCGGLFCLDQAKALLALGHEVRILSNVQLGLTNTKDAYFSLPTGRFEHVMDGITVYQSYQRGIPKIIHYNVNRWVHIVCSMFDDYVQRYGKPDVLHAHCVKWAGYAAMQISRKYRIPYFITEHLSFHDYAREFGMPPSNAWQIPLLKESLLHASCVIPVSKEVVSDLSVFFGTDYRWKSISNMIDTDFFNFQPREPLQGRPYRFCCIGIFIERKGYDVLFSAFQRVQTHYPDAELHIAGPATNSDKCRRMLSDMNIKQGVVIHGEISKSAIRDLLYHSDTLVLATRGETQGLVLLEALSTGIPAISTEAIPLSVRPQEGCVFVPIDDVDALSKAMESVISSPTTDSVRLSEIARQMASPGAIARQIAHVFEESLGQ